MTGFGRTVRRDGKHPDSGVSVAASELRQLSAEFLMHALPVGVTVSTGKHLARPELASQKGHVRVNHCDQGVLNNKCLCEVKQKGPSSGVHY